MCHREIFEKKIIKWAFNGQWVILNMGLRCLNLLKSKLYEFISLFTQIGKKYSFFLIYLRDDSLTDFWHFF